MNVSPFLNQLAEKTLTLNPQDTIIVLPNRRAGIFLKKAIGNLVDKPVFLPSILTIEEFFLQLSGLIKIEKTELLFRLYESHLATHPSPDSFETFLGWGSTFLSDCGEIDTNLIEAEAFFNTLFFDKELRNWNLTDESTEMQKNYLTFWQNAKNLYFHFTSTLLQNGRAYNGLAYRSAINNIEKVFPKGKHVVLAGFNALNKAEEKLFDYVYDNQLGEFFWDIDQYYIEDDENKAGLYFRERYIPKWKLDNQLKQLPTKIGVHTEKIEMIESPNQLAQCEVAAQLVQQLAGEGKFNENTAIVLADEQLLQPLLYQLPKDLGAYNITMGKPVSQFPVYHLFADYFHLQKSIRNRDNFEGYPMAFITPLLLSPFLQAIVKEDAILLYDHMLENNISFLKMSEVENTLGKESLIYKLFKPVKDIETLIAFGNQIIDVLRVELYDTDDGLVRQVLFEIKKILQQFTSFEANLSTPIGFSGFYTLFKQVAQSTKIPYEGEPLAGLQIMGVLETRCLDFDNIILLSANEGTLPQGRSANSFIPFIFKKNFEIQTFQDRDAIYAYSIYRLFHTAKNFYFVYNGQADSSSDGEISRFAKQIEAEFPEKIEKDIPIIHRSANFANQVIDLENYQIEKTPELLKEIEYYLENKGLSPSAIKQLINSPLDFYFQRIARIKEPREFEKDIELSTFGTIVHNSLEELYQPLIGKTLLEEDLKALHPKIEDEIKKQTIEQFKKGNVTRGKNLLYTNAAFKMVTEAIKLDSKRIKESSIKIISLEEDLECEILLQASGKFLNLKLHGKADRIQRRDDYIEIIDYKTGKVDEAKLKIDKIKEISNKPDYEKLNQLLCYITMAHKGKHQYQLSEITAAMQPLKSWDQGLSFINKDKNFTISPNHLEDYIQEIQKAIDLLLDPNIPFEPETDIKRLHFSAYKEIYL